jgi:UDP-MurNAc hydroxylase
MADEILWINHAGYELRSCGVRLVHDPWLEGLAFDRGWALVSPTKYGYDDFRGVDYIWLSHEHPDHFSPPVLRKIPEEIRRSITILFQRTRDGRVVEFCRKIGFRTQELSDGDRMTLKNGLAITCGVVDGDSWLFAETPEFTYFNANDCVGADWSEIAKSLRKPVDVLLTQFSYANWVGNPGETERMAEGADEKIREMEQQLDAFRPRVLIPFASFVWFCRDENFHLNQAINRIDRIYDRFREDRQVVILYPGDLYRIGEKRDSADAIARYLADWQSHDRPMQLREDSVPLKELQRLSTVHQQKLKQKNAMWLLRPLVWAGYIAAVSIYLRDLSSGIRYSVLGGIQARGLARSECDVEFSSSSFANMLNNGYGYQTLHVSGRYRELRPGGFVRLSPHFAIPLENEQGFSLPGMLFRKDHLVSLVRRALHQQARLRGAARSGARISA